MQFIRCRLCQNASLCSVQLTLMAGDTLIKTLPGKTTEIFTSNVHHNNISLYINHFFLQKKCNRLENKLPLIILLFTKSNSLRYKFYIFYMTYFLKLSKKNPKTIGLTKRNQEMPETCMHNFGLI